jgi:AcrR family transcriptional regulator
VSAGAAAGEISTAAILEAAIEAFAERGYEGTSVRDVARSLGGSHNLIPNRIGSKEDLWYAAVDHAARQQYAALAMTFTDRPETEDLREPFARLEALVARTGSEAVGLRGARRRHDRRGPQRDERRAAHLAEQGVVR